MCTQQCANFCEHSKRVWIYFGNGVFNTERSAELSASKLQEKLMPMISTFADLNALVENAGAIEIAYNVDGNSFSQLAQTVDQKAHSEFRHFWTWLSNLNAAPSWFRDYFFRQIPNEDKAFEASDPELREHIATYSDHLRKGDAVIVVSHSQGNFYSHAAYRLLSNRFGVDLEMKIIPIASPEFEETSEGLLNGWPYTTLFSDGIIAMVPHHLPPNTRNSPSGLFDHSFIEHYLGGNVSGPKIVSDIACVASTFRLRRPSLDSILESDFDHEACKHLVPHPDTAKLDAEDQ